MKVILMCAMSLDGKIARNKNDPVDWTSKEDKRFFMSQTKKAGVVLMGRNTFDSIGRVLPDRLNIVFTTHTKKFISQTGKIEFTKEKPEKIIKKLKKRGYKKIMLIGGSELNTYLLNNNLIDEIWLTVESVILGSGVSLFGDVNFTRKVKLATINKLGKRSVLLKYKLK